LATWSFALTVFHSCTINRKPQCDFALRLAKTVTGTLRSCYWCYWRPCVQDPFALGTAQQYVWIDQAPDQAMPLVAIASEVPGSDEVNPVPALQLSSDDVRQQLRLVRTGLLGSGATAHAYACVWPDRFGDTKLLAAKVWGWVVPQHCRPC
jgi:hypothetical protein